MPRLLLALAHGAVAAALVPARAYEPGRSLTAMFEVEYPKFIVDHHFSAPRMTELAAGTDATRNPEISKSEGTSPSPGFSPTHNVGPLLALVGMTEAIVREGGQ